MPILDDYHRDHDALVGNAHKVEQLIAELLDAHQMRVHSVTTRVKTAQSLDDKISREPGRYDDLRQVTDVCGARIITYFEDEVDEIASLIQREFLVDKENSVDKRQALDVDRFGYASVHYVVQLDARRAALSEYKRLAGFCFEVQVRSILQHAWAEIEHDLQYKSKESIPRELRRRFARLAGLLETADVEFRGIRDALKQYRSRVREEIRTQPEIVLIDRDSLTLFVRQSEVVRTVDEEVAAVMRRPLSSGVTNTGFRTVGDAEGELSRSKESIVDFAAEFNRDGYSDDSPVNFGISLFYLAYVVMVRSNSIHEVSALLKQVHFQPKGGTEELAKELLDTQATLRERNLK